MNLMSKQWHLTALFILVLAILILVIPETKVQAQEEKVKVTFTLQIYDIDRFDQTADVNVTLKFENLASQQVAENEPVRALLFGGANIVDISCNETLPDEYVGSSGLTTWGFSGSLARGEYFPFDEGQLLLQIANVLPGPFNVSDAVIGNESYAYFEGPGKLRLNETCVSIGDACVVDMYFGPNLRVTVPLKRRTDSLLMDRSFWLLIVPTLASYYLLACSFFLWKEEDLSNRLRIYVAIFIFSPTFMMAMQGQLPFRVTLAIPEVLLVNLMISTAIFSIFSILPIKNRYLKVTCDGAASYLSIFIALYLFEFLTPVFPVNALVVFVVTLASYGLSAGVSACRTAAFLRTRFPLFDVKGRIQRMKRAWKSGWLTELTAIFVIYIGFWIMLYWLAGNWILFALGLIEVIFGTILFIIAEHFLGIAKSEMTRRPGSEQELTADDYFVGSRNGKVYHRLSCPHTRKILPERRISYKDSVDAKAHGRKPCNICKPP